MSANEVPGQGQQGQGQDGVGVPPQQTGEQVPQQPSTTPEVQPGTQPSTGAGTDDSAIGFIAPYLEGLDPHVKPVVQERLEKYRKDSDAQVNQRLEQSAAQLRTYEQLGDPSQLERANQLFTWMLEDPAGAIEWVVNAYQSEGYDLVSELAGRLGQMGTEQQGTPGQVAQQGSPQQGSPQQATVPNTGALSGVEGQQQNTTPQLTAEQVREIVQEGMQSFQQMMHEQKEAERMAQEVDGYLNESASKYGIQFEGPDDPVKTLMTQQALNLMRSGKTRDAKTAFDLSGQALASRLRLTPGQGQQNNGEQTQTTAPTTTGNAGEGVMPPAPDLSDKKQRRDAALSLWNQMNRQE